jgi:DNA-binding PadR family transcriptional regulator
MRVDRQPRCRCRIGPGRFEVRARIERFAEPAVLLLLAEGRSHGYQLAEDLEALLGEGRVDFGNLYRLLRSLEEEGLVASTWSEEAPGPQKRVYGLTGEGAALLDAWAASLRARSDRINELLARYEALAAPAQPRDTRSGEMHQERDPRDDQGGAP